MVTANTKQNKKVNKKTPGRVEKGKLVGIANPLFWKSLFFFSLLYH